MEEKDILALVAEDAWMMDVLRAARSLELPDWWVCAGFVRSKLWDVLHGFAERTPLPDVDVVYFDPGCLDEAAEKEWERELRVSMPDVPWSVKNEARMHAVNGYPPYASTVDAISKFPETVAALGLSLNADGEVLLAAPCGIGDVIAMTVRPTPFFRGHPALEDVYLARIAKKNWQRIWPRVRILAYDATRPRVAGGQDGGYASVSLGSRGAE